MRCVRLSRYISILARVCVWKSIHVVLWMSSGVTCNTAWEKQSSDVREMVMMSWDHSRVEKRVYSSGRMERKSSRKDWISVKWEAACVRLVVTGGLKINGNDDMVTLMNCRVRRIGTVLG